MRFGLLSLAALPLAAQALEFLDDNSFVEQEGLVRYRLSANQRTPPKNQKRQKETELDNRKTGYYYTIDIEIGSPPQLVAVQFDTGSNELWINPNCDKSGDVEYCKSFGAFGKSSSFVDLNRNGTIAYGRGTAYIEYGYDYVTVGSAKINQQVLGVAYDSEHLSVGILGAGPDLTGWDSNYPYVLDNLYTQKFINSRAFSVDMRSIENDRGSVVFGGIDTKKFSGPLEKRPIIPASASPDGTTRYWIYLDGITIDKQDGSSPITVFDQPNGQPMLLDTGYTISALPSVHFDKILAAFPSAEKSSNSDQYTVDCKVADSKATVDFKFGETVIKVPYADFIWQQPDYDVCVLGVIRDDDFPVLGDTFLRAAYAVFDWDNREIYLANNEDCGSELVAIGSGPGAVPNIVGECGKPKPTTSSAVVSSAAPTTSAINTPTSAPISTPAVNGTATVSPTAGNNTTSLTTTSFSSSAGGNQTTSSKTTITSAITTTTVHTITSCAPTVTNCPVGSVTTEVITAYTTYCPGETETHAPAPTTTTSKYVKPPCPEVTMTIVIPKVIVCTAGMSDCKEGETVTTREPATVTPITPVEKPTPIPGCNDCHPKPKPTDAKTTQEIEVPTSKPAATVPVVPEEPTRPTDEVVVPVIPTTAVPITTMATQAPSGTAPGSSSPVESQPPAVTGGAAGLVAPGFAAAAALIALL